MPYRVGEFAALTGVTVRALQHYDRVGLLKPSRTESGHRIYSEADERRVRHILALRAVGMPLQRIAEVLRAAPARMPEILNAQRASLEQARAGMDEAISTLNRLAAGDDDPSTESLLDRLAATVEMHGVLESMRSYFSEDAWTKWGEGYFTDWPSPAWRAVFRDIEAALDIDPASDRAQKLLKRATTLWDAAIGSDSMLRRAVREGYGNAWNARDRWPRELQRRYAEFRIEAIAKFLGNAAMASWRRNGLIHTYTTGGRASA